MKRQRRLEAGRVLAIKWRTEPDGEDASCNRGAKRGCMLCAGARQAGSITIAINARAETASWARKKLAGVLFLNCPTRSKVVVTGGKASLAFVFILPEKISFCISGCRKSTV